MSSTWGVSLISDLLFAAKIAKSVKILGIIVILVVLLFIVYLMLRSLGLDHKTPPSMVFRKLQVFVASFYVPKLLARKLVTAEELHDNGKLLEALELYLKVFYFDGLTSTKADVAMHNDTVLERIEDICEETEYAFPHDRIARFQEDLYDYFLVKTKYLSPTDYDGTPLHRLENEDRFKDKLNLSQERQLIEGFEHFVTALVNKLERHIKGGAMIHPRGTKTLPPRESSLSAPDFDTSFVSGQVPAVAAPTDPFGGSSQPVAEELPAPPSDPFGGSVGGQELGTPPDPFGAAPAAGGEVSPPDDLFGGGDQNPFSMNDPHDPFNEATGVMHKLPGAADDQFNAPLPAPPMPPAPVAPMPPAPVATGGFPGLGSPAAPGQLPPAPIVQGFGGGMPQPTGGFPGMQAPNNPFPQPTGAFPGLGGAPGIASGMPQPTGGFPGFQAPQPGSQPGLPQATGGFPSIHPQAGGMPQPTGGFPGFQAPQPGSQPGLPQATGGFPGFGQAPQPGGFPQPTGGFPGFGQAPPAPAQGNPFPPNPFGTPGGEKK